ncbi:MAG: hypothetical protein QS721_10220 [Candidatus Endonucleobacter sp. (ex Gigantidas childressi)]|nr:hypothetical protein [Candidatus Endonucleobacter sp. (ex Gigantidas childressi)]
MLLATASMETAINIYGFYVFIGDTNDTNTDIVIGIKCPLPVVLIFGVVRFFWQEQR